MKKCCAALLAALTLIFCVGALAQNTQEEEVRLLTITLNGVAYRLGFDTAEKIAQDGWPMEREEDGTFAFFSQESESWFYARTQDGLPDSPLVFIDLTAADGVAVEYCGFFADDEAQEGDDISLWYWLIAAYGAEVNEEGTLTARILLEVGGTLLIETPDTRVRLTLLP